MRKNGSARVVGKGQYSMRMYNFFLCKRTAGRKLHTHDAYTYGYPCYHQAS